MYWVIGFGVTSIVVLLMWLTWLSFLRWLVLHTKNTKSLRDAAVAARAFPGAGVAGAIGRAFHRDPVDDVARAVTEIVKGPEQPTPDAEPGSP